MTGDMLISGGLCKFSLELLVCLRPPECKNYVEQSLVLTFVFLFKVEVQRIESYNISRSERRRVVLEAL